MVLAELSTGEKYVVAAYLVFLALVLIYVAIMAVRMGRLQREIDELVDVVEGTGAERPAEPKQVPVA